MTIWDSIFILPSELERIYYLSEKQFPTHDDVLYVLGPCIIFLNILKPAERLTIKEIKEFFGGVGDGDGCIKCDYDNATCSFGVSQASEHGPPPLLVICHHLMEKLLYDLNLHLDPNTNYMYEGDRDERSDDNRISWALKYCAQPIVLAITENIAPHLHLKEETADLVISYMQEPDKNTVITNQFFYLMRKFHTAEYYRSVKLTRLIYTIYELIGLFLSDGCVCIGADGSLTVSITSVSYSTLFAVRNTLLRESVILPCRGFKVRHDWGIHRDKGSLQFAMTSGNAYRWLLYMLPGMFSGEPKCEQAALAAAYYQEWLDNPNSPLVFRLRHAVCMLKHT